MGFTLKLAFILMNNVIGDLQIRSGRFQEDLRRPVW